MTVLELISILQNFPKNQEVKVKFECMDGFDSERYVDIQKIDTVIYDRASEEVVGVLERGIMSKEQAEKLIQGNETHDIITILRT
jgi:hypothetical protein